MTSQKRTSSGNGTNQGPNLGKAQGGSDRVSDQLGAAAMDMPVVIPSVSPARVLAADDVRGELKIMSAQMNTRVGDIASNLELIIEEWARADRKGADLLVTPELSLTGYPLEDFVENPDLLETAEKALEQLIERSKMMKSGIIVGLPIKGAEDEYGRNIYNAAFLIEDGKVLQKIRKKHLPNHDVFDEVRNFAKGGFHDPVSFRGCELGIMICEDTWHKDVSHHLAEEGAQVLISINSSPYESHKLEHRQDMVVRERVVETGLPMLYVNQVGGQDEVVFDGASFAMNADLRIAYQARDFNTEAQMLRLKFPDKGHAAFNLGVRAQVTQSIERDYMALVTGTRDYLIKTGHIERGAVLGMSGGLDSGLVAAISADAIGGTKTNLIAMPSKFTADMSNEDAKIAADMLGANFLVKPIEDTVSSLRDLFDGASAGVADENIQARIRGTILMWHANTHGWMLLTTGNKSEVSVGYCTLYGDMNGGFNPLKDVWKTHAFAMAKWRNNNVPSGTVLGPLGPVMPSRIYTRPPSAELAEGQVDTNNLPPYSRLDPILKGYIEDHLSVADIVKRTGEDHKLVSEIVSKVDIAEFKRRQACPGVKISQRSFGRGRRYPIARPTTSRMISALKP